MFVKKKQNPEQNTVRRDFHFGESLPVRVVQRACFFYPFIYMCIMYAVVLVVSCSWVVLLSPSVYGYGKLNV